MFTINRLRLEIRSKLDSTKMFGFDIPFYKGLNIIAGRNSQGKSSINSCIYYGLGMEELLGSQNERALDKALKTEFILKIPNNNSDTHKILFSRLLIEIENSQNKVCTIQRIISSQSDESTSKVIVFDSNLSNISNNVNQIPYFIRNNKNHTDEFGFYKWLSEFIGIELPLITNVSIKNGKSPLYLQTIFSAIFIEQTKGWSDFLASCPYFGIRKNKEKVFEFILNLKELSISSERDRIQKEEKELKNKWNKIVAQLNILESEYSTVFKGIPEDLIYDKDLLKTISILYRDIEKQTSYPLDSLLSDYKDEIEELKKRPLFKVAENKETIQNKLEELYVNQNKFIKKFKDFDSSFNLEKNQQIVLSSQLDKVNEELEKLKGVNNILGDVLKKEKFYKKCPTCTQDVSDDLMASEGVTIQKLTLEENILYLESQQKMIQNSIASLKVILEEKEITRKYYSRKQREYEYEIKQILEELITDDRAFSENDALQRVKIQNEINELEFLRDKFNLNINEMITLSDDASTLKGNKDDLISESLEDIKKLEEFEKIFKDQYLFEFGYDSNNSRNIFIQKNAPFKYFPSFKYNEADKTPKSIRTNSSASDFVRSLWAYTLTLLREGENHPGIVTFDEPGQHSVKSISLKSLFEKASGFKEKQIIVFTSIERVLSKKGEKEDILDINKLLVDLELDKDYHIYTINEKGKSIGLIDELDDTESPHTLTAI